MEENLQGLPIGIPDTTLDNVPCYLQRHMVGVPKRIGHFPCKSRAIMCYSEHNRPLDLLIESPTMFPFCFDDIWIY